MYSGSGRYESALNDLNKILELCNNEKELNSTMPARVYNHMSQVYSAQREFKQRTMASEKALSLSEALAKSPDLLALQKDLVDNMASSYFDCGEFVKAEKMLERMTNSLQANDSLRRSYYMSTLARCYVRKGDYIPAEKLYKKSSAIAEKMEPPYEALILRNQIDLAGIYYLQGKTELCKNFCKKARILSASLPRPDLSRSLDDFETGLKIDNGNFKEAEKKISARLKLHQKSMLEKEPAISAIKKELAYCLHKMGRDKEAKALIFDQDKLRRKAFKAQSVEIGNSEIDLSDYYFWNADYAESIKHRKLALDYYEKYFGKDSLVLIPVYQKLYQAHLASGDKKNAEIILNECIRLGSPHKKSAPLRQTFTDYEKFLRKDGRNKEADQILAKQKLLWTD